MSSNNKANPKNGKAKKKRNTSSSSSDESGLDEQEVYGNGRVNPRSAPTNTTYGISTPVVTSQTRGSYIQETEETTFQFTVSWNLKFFENFGNKNKNAIKLPPPILSL